MVRYLTLTQVAAALGRPEHFKLMRYLLKQANIEPIALGRMRAIPESDLPRMREALKAWENRPRVCA